jgi:hypothetical protein
LNPPVIPCVAKGLMRHPQVDRTLSHRLPLAWCKNTRSTLPSHPRRCCS